MEKVNQAVPSEGYVAGAADDMWQISVDPHRCLASGICISSAPDYFRLAGDFSVPVRPMVAPDPTVMDAADACPAEAILVRESAKSLTAELPTDDVRKGWPDLQHPAKPRGSSNLGQPEPPRYVLNGYVT